jgi:signal transduction histidine kinase
MEQRGPVRHAERFLEFYVAFVAAGGLLLILGLAPAGIRSASRDLLAFGLATTGAVAGEFAGIHVRWRSQGIYYTMASPFVLAVLALWGLPAALLVAATATLVDDRVNRSAARKTLFNLGQAGLGLGAAGLLYALLADGPVVLWRQALAFCVAAVVKLVLSELTVRVAVVIDRQVPSPSYLLSHIHLHMATIVLNVGLTLTVLLAVPQRVLVPVLLGIAILPVYLACRSATRENHARERAEASQLEAETQRNLAEKARMEAEAARADAEDGRAVALRQATERAHLLELANRLADRLHAQARHKDEIMALVAHELHEPLRLIASITTSLRDHDRGLAPDVRRNFLHSVLRQSQHASDAAQRLLLDARHHRTQPTVEPTTAVIDAAELLRWAGQLAALIYHRPIDVRAPKPVPVRASRDAIEDILSTLMENADCHTPHGSPIRLEALVGHGNAVLAVQDHGPGIPPADRDRIFEQFTRLHPESGKRLGLGLYVARSLARRQGGELTAVDPAGSGTGARFELTLRLA